MNDSLKNRKQNNVSTKLGNREKAIHNRDIQKLRKGRRGCLFLCLDKCRLLGNRINPAKKKTGEKRRQKKDEKKQMIGKLIF